MTFGILGLLPFVGIVVFDSLFTAQYDGATVFDRIFDASPRPLDSSKSNKQSREFTIIAVVVVCLLFVPPAQSLLVCVVAFAPILI